MHFHIFFNERLNSLWAVSRDCDMQVMDDGHSLSMPVIHKDKRDRSSLIGWRRFEGYTELIEMTIEQSSILRRTIREGWTPDQKIFNSHLQGQHQHLPKTCHYG